MYADGKPPRSPPRNGPPSGPPSAPPSGGPTEADKQQGASLLQACTPSCIKKALKGGMLCAKRARLSVLAKREQEERLAKWPASGQNPSGDGGYAGYNQPAVNYSNFVNAPPQPTREDGNAYRSGGQMHMTWTNFGQESEYHLRPSKYLHADLIVAPGKEFNSWSSEQQNNYMKPFVSYHFPLSSSLKTDSPGPRSTKVIGTQPKSTTTISLPLPLLFAQ